MRSVTVAVIQSSFGKDREKNKQAALEWIHQAYLKKAQIVLLPELFLGEYFCKTEEAFFFDKALSLNSPFLKDFYETAKRYAIVLPLSFFEKEGPHYYNTVAMIDADGSLLGIYRKSHIPDGPGYEEKYYFRPGNTGFKVWHTRYAPIGVGICWDQWFPECARSMMLQGAELLFYPTAIGSEPHHTPFLFTKDPWQRAMIGHAVSNAVPVMAANRVGLENDQFFYGHSFIADALGNKVQEMNKEESGLLVHTFDLDDLMRERAAWGFFRDRRPDLYGALTHNI